MIGLLVAGSFALVVGLGGCAGGGTDGTGIRQYEGVVRLSSAQSAGRIRLEIAETGESDITDNDGRFFISSIHVEKSATLLVTRDNLTASVTIRDIPEDTLNLFAEIVFDPATGTANATRLNFDGIEKFSVTAQVVGGCAGSFRHEPERIVQTKAIREGLYCSVEAVVTGDREPVGGVLVALQRKGCGVDESWRQVETGYTHTGVHRGVVQLRFKYFDNPRACFYRVVAPADPEDPRASEFLLVTLSGQHRRRS